MTISTDNEVRVGDRIRFALPLLEQIVEEPDRYALLVLKAIQLEPDGTKILVLTVTTRRSS